MLYLHTQVWGQLSERWLASKQLCVAEGVGFEQVRYYITSQGDNFIPSHFLSIYKFLTMKLPILEGVFLGKVLGKKLRDVQVCI